uniref:PH domain-containing protein n=1 Tax=Macrostomum lignano TaxID=282301 RepID=A0A1I8FH13_9PLAT
DARVAALAGTWKATCSARRTRSSSLVRRWFFIKDNRLYYCKKTDASDVTCLEDDLRMLYGKVATAGRQALRTGADRARSDSPVGRPENPADLLLWCTALQSGWQHHRSTRSLTRLYARSASEGLQSLSKIRQRVGVVNSSSTGSSNQPTHQASRFDAAAAAAERAGQLEAQASGRCSPHPIGARQFRLLRLRRDQAALVMCESRHTGVIDLLWVHRSLGVHVSKSSRSRWTRGRPFTAEAHASAGNAKVNAIQEHSRLRQPAASGPTARPLASAQGVHHGQVGCTTPLSFARCQTGVWSPTLHWPRPRQPTADLTGMLDGAGATAPSVKPAGLGQPDAADRLRQGGQRAGCECCC